MNNCEHEIRTRSFSNPLRKKSFRSRCTQEMRDKSPSLKHYEWTSFPNAFSGKRDFIFVNSSEGAEVCKQKQIFISEKRFNSLSKVQTLAEFESLYEEWKNETMFTSSTSKIVEHPCYLRIINMGQRVIPSILEKLKVSPDHFSVALNILTGENPVEEKYFGDMSKVSEIWVHWGIENGYID